MLQLTIWLLILLVADSSGQVTQCSPSDTQPKLRFVAQLSINGCLIIVHDTGANDGPHLAVEPLMCVTQSLKKILPRYDPVSQHWYVSVPVMLRDDAMLTEVQAQLRHLSPKSVKFATVSDISVSTDNSSGILQSLGFMWSPDEPVGILRLGCSRNFVNCTIGNLLRVINQLRESASDIVDRVLTTAKIEVNDTEIELRYNVVLQNSSFFDPVERLKLNFLPNCNNVIFVRSVYLGNCTARVHQRLDMKGNFLTEPLLCHNITRITDKSIMYDNSRDMYYLKLDVVLQDDITLDAVRSKLADLSPLNVTFMRLWRAESVVASALSRRYQVGPLMVSVDWRSAHMRVYCSSHEDCSALVYDISIEPQNLFRHIKFSVTSLAPTKCIVKTRQPVYMLKSKYIDSWDAISNDEIKDRNVDLHRIIRGLCALCQTKIIDGRMFVLIQQRLTGSVSFERTWREYEAGFGDANDFWVGLSSINSFSFKGVTLRVEMKLWNGTELHAEFAGFKVEDASTNYRMTYQSFNSARSTAGYASALRPSNATQFSTMDRDNDQMGGSCSIIEGGKNGWWYARCHYSHPNGKYGGGISSRDMRWDAGSKYLALREIRLMLEFS